MILLRLWLVQTKKLLENFNKIITQHTFKNIIKVSPTWLDNNYYNFHDVFNKNNVDVNVINVTLKLNVKHIATADPRTETRQT